MHTLERPRNRYSCALGPVDAADDELVCAVRIADAYGDDHASALRPPEWQRPSTDPGRRRGARAAAEDEANE